MTTITWQIEWMSASTQQINGFSEVVLSAGWRCNGTDNATPTPNVASVYGSVSFPEPQTGGQFTPYAQLTQAQVLGWCYANGVNQSEIETSVTTQVNNLVNPPVIQPPLPWDANVTVSTTAA